MLDRVKDICRLPVTWMVAYFVIGVVLVLVSVLALDIPVVAAGAIFILETLLAVCLSQIPLWIHGLVVIAQIVAGIVTSRTVFMLLMAVIYVCAVAVLYFMVLRRNEA